MMYTLCPHCLTVSRVQATQLNEDAGVLACPHCHTRFNSLGRLYDQVLEAQGARMASQAASTTDAVQEPQSGFRVEALPEREGTAPAPQQASQPFVAPLPALGTDWDAFGQPPLERLPPEPLEIASGAELRQDLAEEMLTELGAPRGPSARTWMALAFAAVLVVLLAGQVVYQQRDQWAQDPQWRPWLERFCDLLRCQLPLRRDVSRIELLERDVRDHPQVEDAVLINATFVNRADFAQPYPVFEVGFSDLAGTLVAQRRFEPREYLPESDSFDAGLAPDEPVKVRLEVLDPGRRAVSFKLEFL